MHLHPLISMGKLSKYSVGLGLVFGAAIGSVYGRIIEGASMGLIFGVVIFALSKRKNDS